MKIALLAPLWKKVPPDKYGGVELGVANLAKGLVSCGHEVTTFACGGSSPEGRVVEVIPEPMYDLAGGFDWSGVKGYDFLSFFELGKRIAEFDVVNNQMGLHPIALSPLMPVPMVTTLHSSLPPDFPYLADAFCKEPFISVSDAQRALAPALNYVATVLYGIDVASFTPRGEGSGKGFLFLGTISYNKGVDIAIRTAQALGVPLILAGEVRDGDRAFFEKEVVPHLDSTHIRFVGEVGHAEKEILLREASALLFPSRWIEAFGLVMVEAFACGTPVVALGNGSVPEVIVHGRTGFIADDESSFVEQASRVHELSRLACRREAEERFNLSRMANDYAAVFETLIDHRRRG